MPSPWAGRMEECAQPPAHACGHLLPAPEGTCSLVSRYGHDETFLALMRLLLDVFAVFAMPVAMGRLVVSRAVDVYICP